MGGLFFPALDFFFLEPAAAFGRLGAARRFTGGGGGGGGGGAAMGRINRNGYPATSGKENLYHKTSAKPSQTKTNKDSPGTRKTLPDHDNTVNSKESGLKNEG
jgi:hypothetical protein